MSQSVIGALRVNLGLDSANFESGAKRVQNPLKEMRSQFLAVAGAALALGTALSAAAIKGANDIDKVAKSARRVNSSIGGFRALEMAAGEAGVDVETLADGLQTMDREIAKGSKGAIGSLGQLGIAVADLDGLEADQKLALVSDKIQELGLSSGEASAVLQGLGIRNKEMLLAIMSGGDVFRSARADVEDYGLALSSVESDKIEVANDAIGRLGLIGQYVGQQLALAIVPTMGALAQAMTDSLREGGLLRTVIDGLIGSLDVIAYSLTVAVAGFGIQYVGALALAQLATFSLTGALALLRTALIRTGIGALVVSAGYLISKFMDLVESAGGFGAAMGLLGDVAGAVWQGIIDSASAIPPALNGVWSLMKAGFFNALAAMAAGISRFAYKIGNGLEGVPGMSGVSEALMTTGDETGASASDFSTGADAYMGEASSSFAKSAGIIKDAFAPARDAVAALKGVAVETAAALDGAAAAASGVGDAMEGAGGAGKGGAALDKLTDKTKTLKSTMEEVRGTMQGAFTGILTGAKSLKDAIGDLLGKFADMLANQAFDALWGGMSGGGKSGGGFGGFIGKILGFANGTPSAPGGMALVGERGPELVNLPRGSRVNTAQQTKSMMGGGGGTMSINVNVSGARGNAEIEQMVASGVRQGISGYDRQMLPGRVAQINSDRRRIG